MDLRYRSNEGELMDDPNIDKADLKIALSDISRVNKWLGGSSITINAVDHLINNAQVKNEYVIVDLGCGDGEMLREIADFFRKKKVTLKLIGVDLNKKSLEYAKQLSILYPEITFEQKDILDINASQFECDILICTLTLHHLTCEEIKKVIGKAQSIASLGIVINDLQRSTIAYYLFTVFSFFFIKGYIAKNDGLISIKRGFKKRELIAYADALHLKQYKIDWKWAFRYRWIIETKYV